MVRQSRVDGGRRCQETTHRELRRVSRDAWRIAATPKLVRAPTKSKRIANSRISPFDTLNRTLIGRWVFRPLGYLGTIEVTQLPPSVTRQQGTQLCEPVYCSLIQTLVADMGQCRNGRRIRGRNSPVWCLTWWNPEGSIRIGPVTSVPPNMAVTNCMVARYAQIRRSSEAGSSPSPSRNLRRGLSRPGISVNPASGRSARSRPNYGLSRGSAGG